MAQAGAVNGRGACAAEETAGAIGAMVNQAGLRQGRGTGGSVMHGSVVVRTGCGSEQRRLRLGLRATAKAGRGKEI